MLSVAKLTARSRNSANEVADYLLAEYYLDEHGATDAVCEWAGAGATALGLAGKVEKQALANILKGYSPKGEKLARNAGDNHRRLGDDLTFSCDKSISILLASASSSEQQAVIRAGNDACDDALEFLRSQMTAYGMQNIAGFTVARHTHFANREGEPDLHFHNCVANLALCDDGKFRAFDNAEFLRLQKTAGALFRASLATRLAKQGYQLEKHRELNAHGEETGNVWHKVSGIDRKTELAFSTRRKQILEAVGNTGMSASSACIATRKGKEANYAQMIEHARNTLGAMRADNQIAWNNTQDLRGHSKFESVSDEEILTRLHARESHWTKNELITMLAKEHGGGLSVQDILAESEAFLKRAKIEELASDASGAKRFASQAQKKLEDNIAIYASKRMNDRTVQVAAEIVQRSIEEHEQQQGFQLSSEQRQAVEFVASKSGGIACLTGQAGTGKTATAGAYVKAFQANGQTVVGCALGWNASKKLGEETGLETHSIKSLLLALESRRVKFTSKTVLIADEAGMIGAKHIRALQQHIDRAGGKLVLLGDSKQLQPIDAGAGFSLAIEATGDVKLTDVRRQRREKCRAISRMFYGMKSGKDIVVELEKNGHIRQTQTQAEARKQLLDDYFSEGHPDALILASTHREIDALTHEIRARLKEEGRLGYEMKIQTRGTLKDEKITRSFAMNDRIRFTTRDRKLGVVNGTSGKLVSITKDERHDNAVVLSVLLDDNNTISFSSKDYDAFEHNYASTVHKSQGQGKEHVYWLAGQPKFMSRECALVAFTRHKDTLKLYATNEGKRTLAERLDKWNEKQNVRDLTITAIKERATSIAQKLRNAFSEWCERRAELKLARSQSLSTTPSVRAVAFNLSP